MFVLFCGERIYKMGRTQNCPDTTVAKAGRKGEENQNRVALEINDMRVGLKEVLERVVLLSGTKLVSSQWALG